MTALTIALALVRDHLLLAGSALERGDVLAAEVAFAAANVALEVAIGALRDPDDGLTRTGGAA